MKKFIHYILLLLSVQVNAQTGLFVNGPDASLLVDSNSMISIGGDFQNISCDPLLKVRFAGELVLEGSFINNDSLIFFPSSHASAGRCRVTFRGYYSYLNSSAAVIAGAARTNFYAIQINKGIGSYLTLNTDIVCQDTLDFKSGFLRINNHKIILRDPAGNPSVVNHPYFKNERQGCQILPVSALDTGAVLYQTIFTSSVDILPANMGIAIKGLLDIGSKLKIRRGFKSQVYAGKSGILTYFDVESQYPLAGNNIEVDYTLNDLQYYSPGYFATQDLRMFISNQQDMNWYPLKNSGGSTNISTGGPYDGTLKTALSGLRHPHAAIDSSLFRITIADPNCTNPPVSALTADTLHICAAQSQTLDAGNNVSVPNTNLKYEWTDTGVGTTSYSRFKTVTPDNSYQKIRLLLMDVRGCISEDSIIIAPAAPYPVVKYLNHLNACEGDSITIKDTITITSGTFVNTYTFSDNTSISTNSNLFRKKFPNAGQYAFQITSTSDHGCSVVQTRSNAEVYAPPTANFSHVYDCATENVHFTNLSISNHTALAITSSTWNSGLPSATSQIIHSPVQNYSVSGNYTVSLKVKNSFGCLDSITAQILIQPKNHAAFTKNNACENDTVFLFNSSNCQTGNCSYSWDLGDQTTDTLNMVKKIYQQAGTYPIKLKLTSSTGCPDSMSTLVFVNPVPHAQFSAGAASLCVNETLYLQNLGTISSGSIISSQWNFGNGSGTVALHSSTSYSQSGNYTVDLQLLSDSGCVDLTQQQIQVRPQPHAQFVVSDVCRGEVSQFSASPGVNNLYIWDFGDLASSGPLSVPQVDHTYQSAGQYSVQLIVIDLNQCSDTASQLVTVHQIPTPPFSASVNTCGNEYILDALNPGSFFSWLPGSVTTQTYAALKSGKYKVLITNSVGCSIEDSVILLLNSIVEPDLGPDTTVCGPMVLDAGYPGSQFVWNNAQQSQKIYVTGSGSYHVLVTDQNNCSGADTISIIVKPQPVVDLGNDKTLCSAASGALITPTLAGAVSYTWSNGSNSTSLNISKSGLYWLQAIGANGCMNGDSVLMTILPAPSIELGADTASCGSLVLDAKNTGKIFLWEDGSSAQYHSVLQTVLAKVKVTDPLNNCSSHDSVHVIIHSPVLFSLGPDTVVCDNSKFMLSAAPGMGCLWNTGDTTSFLQIKSPGVYGATVTSQGGCKGSDHITVGFRKSPSPGLQSYVRYLCGNTPVRAASLSAGTFSWTGPGGFSSTLNEVALTREGKYFLSVTDQGCSSSDSLLVVRSTNTLEANFLVSSMDTINRPVQFVNLSQPEPLWQKWDFGDGQWSNELNPAHTYLLPDNYEVTLEVGNGYCTDKVKKSLSALFRTMKQEAELGAGLKMVSFKIFPNPANDLIHLKFVLSEQAACKVEVYDIAGKTILLTETDAKELEMPVRLTQWASGIYTIQFIASNNKTKIHYRTRFIKTH